MPFSAMTVHEKAVLVKTNLYLFTISLKQLQVVS
jgi:hypothetical protein